MKFGGLSSKLGIVVGLVFVALSLTFVLTGLKSIKLFSAIGAIDRSINDTAFRIREYSNQENQIPTDAFVIIDIDDESLEKLGRIQLWPREYDARVIRHIAQGNPAAVGVDVLFIEKDTLSSVYTDILQKKGFKNAQTIISSLSTDNELVQAVSDAGNIYLSAFDDDAQTISDSLAIKLGQKLPLLTVSQSEASRFFSLKKPQLPFNELTAVAKSVGTISMDKDQDGVIRFYPLFQKWPGSTESGKAKLVSNFPFYMFIDLMGLDLRLVRINDESITIGDDVTIPINDQGSFRLNWLGNAESFRHISYYKILQGLVPPEFFENKVVFIGTSAAGLQDIKTVPTSDVYPGVDVHVTALFNMVNRSWLSEISFTNMIPFLLIIGIALQFLFFRLSPIWSLVMFLLITTAEILLYLLYVFPVIHLLVHMSTLLIFTFLCFVQGVIYRYFTEDRKKQILKTAFQSYVAPELVEHIIEDFGKLALGGNKKQLTVLFSDIRGFTTYSEQLDPQDLVKFLNGYLSRMSNVILEEGGTIDKFIGDAIMAIFGAPVENPEHAKKACMSALGMVRELQKMNTELKSQNKPPIDIGIGLNTGDMTVGNIGSERRFDYTVIGDSVNLGARLEGLNKYFGTHILVSEFTKNECSHFEFIFREISTVKVKGKEKPVTIFELLEDNTQIHRFQPLVDAYNKGLSAFKEQNFTEAQTYFGKALELRPEDGPSLYYQKLTESCIADPSQFTLVLKMETK